MSAVTEEKPTPVRRRGRCPHRLHPELPLLCGALHRPMLNPNCQPPRSWDHMTAVSATVMGPPFRQSWDHP